MALDTVQVRKVLWWWSSLLPALCVKPVVFVSVTLRRIVTSCFANTLTHSLTMRVPQCNRSLGTTFYCCSEHRDLSVDCAAVWLLCPIYSVCCSVKNQWWFTCMHATYTESRWFSASSRAPAWRWLAGAQCTVHTVAECMTCFVHLWTDQRLSCVVVWC